jgi:2-polyprenyl-6-methoxyphenol hydroxylase-like FAD-dependent oxidoreductase
MGEYLEKSNARRPSIIVVGAGAGGVATAARLASAGCKVTVVEKNDFSGGRCSLIHRQNYVGNVDDILRLDILTDIRDSTKAQVYFYFPACSTKHSTT